MAYFFRATPCINNTRRQALHTRVIRQRHNCIACYIQSFPNIIESIPSTHSEVFSWKFTKSNFQEVQLAGKSEISAKCVGRYPKSIFVSGWMFAVDCASMSQSDDSRDDDLSVCQQCNKVLRDPQLFPCFHAFCVPCLDGMNHTAGTRVCCPLCGAAVIVASGGLGALPGSQFVRKLVKLTEIFGGDSTRSSPCDVCNSEENCKSGGSSASKISTRY